MPVSDLNILMLRSLENGLECPPTMLAILNILLAIVAAAATLSAFGGDTWDKERTRLRFIKRIKPRGWVFLGCLLLTLTFGILKELEAKRQEQVKTLAAQKDADNAHAELAALKTELLQTHSTLSHVETDLEKETTANLISTLSNSQKHIKEAWLFLPLKGAAPVHNDARRVLLEGMNQSGCIASTDVGHMPITVDLFLHSSANRSYMIDFGGSPTPFNENKYSRTTMNRFNGGGEWIEGVDDKSGWNGYVLEIGLKIPIPEGEPAASFVSDLYRYGFPSFSTNGDCVKENQSETSPVLDHAEYVLVLDRETEETILFNLRSKLSKTKKFNQEITLSPEGAPKYNAFPLRFTTHPLQDGDGN